MPSQQGLLARLVVMMPLTEQFCHSHCTTKNQRRADPLQTGSHGKPDRHTLPGDARPGACSTYNERRDSDDRDSRRQLDKHVDLRGSVSPPHFRQHQSLPYPFPDQAGIAELQSEQRREHPADETWSVRSENTHNTLVIRVTMPSQPPWPSIAARQHVAPTHTSGYPPLVPALADQDTALCLRGVLAQLALLQGSLSLPTFQYGTCPCSTPAHHPPPHKQTLACCGAEGYEAVPLETETSEPDLAPNARSTP